MATFQRNFHSPKTDEIETVSRCKRFSIKERHSIVSISDELVQHSFTLINFNDNLFITQGTLSVASGYNRRKRYVEDANWYAINELSHEDLINLLSMVAEIMSDENLRLKMDEGTFRILSNSETRISTYLVKQNAERETFLAMRKILRDVLRVTVEHNL